MGARGRQDDQMGRHHRPRRQGRTGRLPRGSLPAPLGMTRSVSTFEGRTILVTGGAGFIGSRVARFLAAYAAGAHVIAMDNLRRRGAELNLKALRAARVDFQHGDVRVFDDFPSSPASLALIVDCSADPS